MSEYQRYEWIAIDRPLTRAQLDAVENLSSHIDASSTHAIIEYNWGDFKHDQLEVLRKYFDGFLYWANWGSPQLALRFPHGILPADLIDGYDYDDDVVTFIRRADYDILDIHFGEMEGPDEWVDTELGSLIAIREELMEGDLRALYIVWLANQMLIEGYEEEEEESEEEEDYEISVPPVPPAMGRLTAVQEALAVFFQVPEELLVAAGRHSSAAVLSTGDDLAAWVTLLPPERRDEYLVRLAHNEPGLSRLLVKELRELGQNKTSATPPMGERVTYATLVAESKAIRVQLEREEREREHKQELEKREQERQARQQLLQNMHEYQDTYWRQADKAAARASAAGYDEAAQLLVDLRDSANQFNEAETFRERFHTWIQSHLRRPALLRRLRDKKFSLPEA